MYTTRTPLEKMLIAAENMQGTIQQVCANFELAMEQRQVAIQAFESAESAYYAQEEKLPFEIGCNDKLLTNARIAGQLQQAWSALTQATNVRDEAELSYQQMEARFKAVLVAAELQSSMLRAAALG